MMTPAELKTIREAVGLSVSDLAGLAGVQERTARYWESGRSAVPADVADLVLGIDAMLAAAAAQAADLVRKQAQAHGAPERVTLVRYRDAEDLWRFRPDFRPLPVTTHAALLARVRAALAEQGVQTRIVYLEPAA